MQILWAFRSNAPEDGRFPISMDCSGRYRAPGIPRAAQRLRRKKFTAKSKTGKGEEAKKGRSKKRTWEQKLIRLLRLRGYLSLCFGFTFSDQEES
jgi:hypothetical protein